MPVPTDRPRWARHLVDPSRPVDVLAEESLPRAWTARWREAPGHIVVRTPGGTTLTAAALEERSAQVASRYAVAGLVPGDRIVFSAGASIDLIVAYVAAHRYGLVVVPINTAYGRAEVAHAVRNTRPAAAVVDDSERGAVISEVASSPCRVFGVEVHTPDGPDVQLDASRRDTPALICHTSGTTGAPKGAVLTSGNLLASAQGVRLAWRWQPDDSLALALPLFHLHGLGVGVHGTLVSGATMMLLGGFDPGAVASAADAGASMFFGVPTMYHRLVGSGAAAALRTMRLCVSGSAPLSPELWEGFERASGQRILERYGMTETIMNVSNPYDGERRPGSVGFPLPGVELALDAGDAPDVRATGEILLRGPNVFAGYWENPEATRAAFTADGWFSSGDIGQFDADGYLQIVGRSKELIISGGYNVYPREVEDVLDGHPAVSEVAVVGIPSAEWGETVTAVVVAAGPVSADELMAFAATRLASYKRPRQVRFVESLPRNALGKVLRNELVEG